MRIIVAIILGVAALVVAAYVFGPEPETPRTEAPPAPVAVPPKSKAPPARVAPIEKTPAPVLEALERIEKRQSAIADRASDLGKAVRDNTNKIETLTASTRALGSEMAAQKKRMADLERRMPLRDPTTRERFIERRKGHIRPPRVPHTAVVPAYPAPCSPYAVHCYGSAGALNRRELRRHQASGHRGPLFVPPPYQYR